MIDRPRPSRAYAGASEKPSPPSSLTILLTAASRYWYLILISIVLAGVVGYLYGSSRPAEYQSTASIYFRNSSVADRILGGNGNSSDPDSRRQTQIDQIKLPSVSTRAAASLGEGYSTGDVQNAFEVESGGQSDIVKLTAKAPQATEAAAIANAVVDAAVAFRAENARHDSTEALKIVNDRLSRMSASERTGVAGQTLVAQQSRLQLEVASPGGDAEVAQRARIPTESIAPAPAKTAVLAGGLGLFLGLGLALLRARLDPRVMSQGEFLDLWPVPVLATLPKDRVLAKGSFQSASSASLAPLVIARTSLRYLSSGAPAKVIGFTSAIAGEGKSTVTWGVASAAASEGERVLLLELDLRSPTIERERNIAPSAGVAGFLRGEAAFEEIVRPGGEGTDLEFDVVTAGTAVDAPLSLLRSNRANALFEAARGHYDLILVDLPPVTLVPDALTIAHELDGFAVVSRMRWVSPSEVQRERDLLEELDENEAPVFGVIVNGNRGSVPAAYGSGSPSRSRR